MAATVEGYLYVGRYQPTLTGADSMEKGTLVTAAAESLAASVSLASTVRSGVTAAFESTPSTPVFGAGVPALAALGLLTPVQVLIVEMLEGLTGLPLLAIVIVLSVLLFGGPYTFARRHDLGTAHAVGAGISGLGFVVLFLIVMQLLVGIR